MDEDVQATVSEVSGHLRVESLDREIAYVLVALVFQHLGGCVGHRVVRGVERVYALELQQRSIGKPTRVVQLTAFDQRSENVERGRPGRGAYRGASFGEGFGNRETETIVVRDTRYQRATPAEVDWKHG